MKPNIFVTIILLIVLAFTTKAQEWSEPVTVFAGGANYDPDFAIDSNGTLHVVWEHEITDFFRKIYYAKSTDQGETWSEPYDLAQNSDSRLAQPSISVGLGNVVYVSYDCKLAGQQNTNVYLQVFEGDTWGQPMVVSEGTASWYSKLAVDNDGMLHIIWFYNPTGKFRIRTYFNGEFSQITEPISGNSNWYAVYSMLFDKNNVLHCAAQMLTSSSYYSKLVYFTYHDNQWSDVTIVADTMVSGAMAIDPNNNPRNVWWSTTGVGLYHTYYSAFNNGIWSPVLRLAGRSDQHSIIVEKNGTEHIVQSEKIAEGYRHMHYINRNGIWKSEELWSGQYGSWCNKLLFFDTTMYLLYGRTIDDDIYDRSVVIRKKNIDSQVSINALNASAETSVYPNPANNRFTIETGSLQNSHCDVIITDLKGSAVHFQNSLPIDGEIECETNDLQAGVYFLTVRTSQTISTTKLIITK